MQAKKLKNFGSAAERVQPPTMALQLPSLPVRLRQYVCIGNVFSDTSLYDWASFVQQEGRTSPPALLVDFEFPWLPGMFWVFSDYNRRNRIVILP